MKILAIIFHFPPISGGGVIVAVELVNNFAKLGHEVTVVTPNLDWTGPKYEPEIDPKIKVSELMCHRETKSKLQLEDQKNNSKRKVRNWGGMRILILCLQFFIHSI